MRISVLFLSICLISQTIQAQDFSNKGKDFWLCYPAHIDGTSSTMALYISATQNATGTVILPNGSIPFTVIANKAVTVVVDPKIYPVINSQQEGKNIGKGIHIVSDNPIVVYAHILNAARSGSSLILPTNTLGRDYLVASCKSSKDSPAGNNTGNDAGSQFTVVGIEDNTTIEITPKCPSVASTGNPSKPANIPFTVTLNKGDVYQFRSTWDNDVTGTRVRSLATTTTSCKPIAVFSGSSWTSLNCTNASGGDNLFLQLMPKSALGKYYITAPFADREYDIFRILVDDPTTIVYKNGIQLTGLISNSYYEFSSSAPNVITSDKPIMVVQFLISQNCDSRNAGNVSATAPWPGDPEMIILNPIEQTVNDVTVVSARNNLIPGKTTQITKHFFTIIMKSNATGSLKIDGATPTGIFVPIATTGYSYLQENMTSRTLTNESHRINADSGFIALAYGLGTVESYGYNAGTNLKDLYQYISIQNDYATVNFPAACKSSPFKFSMTFPYKPTQIQWVFGANLNALGLTDTAYSLGLYDYDDSVFVNGRSIFKYTLKRKAIIPTIGTYPIKVFANNPTPDGCSGIQEVAYDLQVFNPPVSDFSVAFSGCVTDPTSFTDKTNSNSRTIIKYSWDFGDNTYSSDVNPTHQYTTPGNKTIKFSTITDVGCLSDTFSKVILVAAQPKAIFGFSSITCEKANIIFSDTSTTPDGTINKWNWDFGDNTKLSVSNGIDQSHVFASAKTYTVSLMVESSSGCKSPIASKSIVVYPQPLADFSLPVVCLPLEASFNDLSSIADNSQSKFKYSWDFGNSIQSNKGPTVTNLYTGTGPFDVKLIITSDHGCVDDTTKKLTTVYAKAKADFNVSPENCLRDTTYFTDKSSGSGNVVSKWFWTFGDKQNSTAQSPTHKYLSPGTYKDSLYIVTDKGCYSDTIEKINIVHPLPTASFILSTPLCEKNQVSFTDKSNPNVGSLTKWSWNFGDNKNENSQSPYHIYDSANNYKVSLVVESSKGCISDTSFQNIKINYLPRVNFGVPEVCFKDPVATFTDSTTIPDNSGNYQYKWYFDDPIKGRTNFSSAANPNFSGLSQGKFQIALVVTSAAGCIDSLTKDFYVNGAVPKSSFNVNNPAALCSNMDVTITDASTVDFGNIGKLEVYWDYGNDPTIKTLDDLPTGSKTYPHAYPFFAGQTTKSFTVHLIAYSGISCKSEVSKTVVVNGSPAISFNNINPVCEEISPFTLSYASETSGLIGTWSYSGNGVMTNTGLFNPAVAKAGTHTIRYTFLGQNTCTDYKEKTIVVYPTPIANAGSDKSVLEGGTVQLDGSGVGNNLRFLWSPPTAIDTLNIPKPRVTPLDDITYYLNVISADGCTAKDDVFVRLLKAPRVPNAFSPNGDGINDYWVIDYLDTYPGATVEVFNRYGQLIFHSTGYPKAWDGTVNGNPLPMATYYWIINPKNGRKQMSGSVTIFR